MVKKVDSFTPEAILFEKRLLSAQTRNTRVGWVSKILPGIIRLSVNPWNYNILNNEYYYLPEDLDIEEGRFVEVTIGKWGSIVEKIERGTTLASEHIVTGEVEAIRLEPDIQFPRMCNMKSFQNYFCQSWEGAEHDNIHWTVPLQLVSCPAHTFKKGGVGSKSIQYDNLMGPVDDLKKLMDKACPSFLRKKNTNFYFNMINNMADVSRLKIELNENAAREISYNIVPLGRLVNDGLFVSLPTLLKNSIGLKKKPTFDLDYYDYLLSTHLIRPVIDKGISDLITKYIQEARDNLQQEFEIFNVDIDPHTYTRIGMAYCRMNHLQVLDEYSLSRSVDVINEVMSDYFDQLKHLYTDERTDSLIHKRKISKTIDWRHNLNKNESTVLSIIEKKYDRGKEEVHINWICQSLKETIKEDDCVKTVDILISKGYLYQPNGVYSVIPVGRN